MQYMYFAKKLPQKIPRIEIRPNFWILLSVSIIFIPIPWLFAWMIAALVHEVFHILALKLLGLPICKVVISHSGACIEANLQPDLKMAFCGLAGPISGFLLLSIAQIFPRIAICGFLLSLFNLIPISPLDGGRVLTGIVHSIFPKQASIIINIIQIAAKLTIFFAAFYAFIRWGLGILPLLLLSFAFTKKYLANRDFEQYNMDNRN